MDNEKPNRLTLGQSSKKRAAGQEIGSALALGSQFIAMVVTPLNLPADTQETVVAESKWLFAAIDHLFKIHAGDIDRAQPVPQPVPASARLAPQANNCLLPTFTEEALAQLPFFWRSSTPLSQLEINLGRNLKHLLNQEASQGEAGKGNVRLQDQIKEFRLRAVETVQQVADIIEPAFGILMPSPKHLVDLLTDDLNPLLLGSQVNSKVITPLGLAEADEGLVMAEVKWLFSATQTYQTVYRAVQAALQAQRETLRQEGWPATVLAQKLLDQLPIIRQQALSQSQPVAGSIPPEAERSEQANNRLLKMLDDDQLNYYFDLTASGLIVRLQKHPEKTGPLLTNIKAKLNNLGALIQRESRLGEAGKRNIELQNQLQHEQRRTLELVQQLADHMGSAYEIYLSTPAQLVELTAGEG